MNQTLVAIVTVAFSVSHAVNSDRLASVLEAVGLSPIPAKWQPDVALAAGLLSGFTGALLDHQTWQQALVSALVGVLGGAFGNVHTQVYPPAPPAPPAQGGSS